MAPGTAGNEIGLLKPLARALPAPAAALSWRLRKRFPSTTAALLNSASAGSAAQQTTTITPFVYINNPACVQAQTLGPLSLAEDALIFPPLAT
jgi:hypothetical protein